MAIYHFHASVVSHGDGKSALGASCYVGRCAATSPHDGRRHDHRRKAADFVAGGVELPEGAPGRWHDPVALWSEADGGARRADEQVARHVNVALPRELGRSANAGLARRIARTYAEEGMCVQWAFHDDRGDVADDACGRNPHAHFLLTVRPCDGGGFGAKLRTTYRVRNEAGDEREATASELRRLDGYAKVFAYKDGRELTQAEAKASGLHPTRDRRSRAPLSSRRAATDWDTRDALERWRVAYEREANDALASHGSAERIDHRSYRDRGVERIPTLHEGPAVTALEREAGRLAAARGSPYEPVTEVRRKNLLIRAINERVMAIMERIRRMIQAKVDQAREEGRRSGREDRRRRARDASRRPHARRTGTPRRDRRTPGTGLSK